MNVESENLIGKRFNHLVVVSQIEDGVSANKGYKYTRWLCKCDCGNEKEVSDISLRSGHTKSCGCMRSRSFAYRPNRRKYCKYDLSGEYGVGYTNNNGNMFYFDLDDYDKIKNYSWSEHILTNGYHALEAWDYKQQKVVRMPWLIVGKNYDHANRNPLDNRKENLRKATQEENAANHSRQKSNKSGVIGVYWNKNSRKWRATLKKSGVIVMARDFDSFDDAVVARLLAEVAFFGEFSPQKEMLSKYFIRTDVL